MKKTAFLTVKKYILFNLVLFIILTRQDGLNSYVKIENNFSTISIESIYDGYKGISSQNALFISYQNRKFIALVTRSIDCGKLIILNISDIDSYSIFYSKDLKDVEGAWALHFFNDTLFIGTYRRGKLLAFYFNTKILKELADVGRSAYIWEIDHDTKNIYFGIYPGGIVYEYNILKSKLFKLISLKNREHVRTIRSYKEFLLIGAGSPAELFLYNKKSKKLYSILPKIFKSDSFVYSVKLSNGKIYCLLNPSDTVLIFSSTNFKLKNKLDFNNIPLKAISPKDQLINFPDNSVLYLINRNKLFRNNIKTNPSLLQYFDKQNDRFISLSKDGYLIYYDIKKKFRKEFYLVNKIENLKNLRLNGLYYGPD